MSGPKAKVHMSSVLEELLSFPGRVKYFRSPLQSKVMDETKRAYFTYCTPCATKP